MNVNRKLTGTILAVGLLAMAMLAARPAAAQTVSKSDTYGYTATNATVYSFVDISGSGGGTSVLAGVDDGMAALNLPFSFSFYGSSYNVLCASTNGAIYFVTGAATCATLPNDFANTDLSVAGPPPAPPNDKPALLPLWSDLTFQVPGAGAIYYQVIGSTGSRRFIVQWSNAYPQGSANPVTFQAVLSETTNTIAFQYQTVTLGGGNPASNGAQATVGIRNAGGVASAQQIEWSFDVPVLANSYAILFAPPAASSGSGSGSGGGSAPLPAVITWSNPASIVYGTALSSTQLNAFANLYGTFVYNPPAGTILNAGTQTLSVTFTPTSTAFAGSTATVKLVVTQAKQTVSFGTIPSHLSTAPPFALTASASSGLPVTFSVLSGPATVAGNALTVTGTGTVTVQATQAGNTNYSAAPAALQSFTVSAPASAVITWNTPTPIVYGTALGTAQLNAVSTLAGTFAYNPPAGTILNAGLQTLSANFTPSTAGVPASSASVTLLVNPAPQVISFGAIPNHLSTDAPFALSATSSAGLPVVFSVVSGPATIASGVLTLTGTGAVVVEADQPGNSNISAAPSVTQSFNVSIGAVTILSVVNAASYASGPLAADAFETAFGTDFATQATSATTVPLPTQLGGATLTITDSAGVTKTAPLDYVSAAQINFIVPEGLAAGPATVTIANSAGQSSTFAVTIGSIAPALFTSNASGSGAASAFALTFAPDGSYQVSQVANCTGSPVTCQPVPINLSQPGTSVYLELFGTGIRGVGSLGGVTVTVAGKPMTVTYAGAQPTFAGLDQVNVLLDPSLAGSGTVALQLTVNGIAANPVQVNIQ